MHVRWVLFGLLIFCTVPCHAGKHLTCPLILAVPFQGKLLPTLDENAHLSREETQALVQLESAVEQSTRGDDFGYWSFYEALAEREFFFSNRASALYAVAYDEDNRRWNDDTDAEQFEIFSLRALMDQCTLLALGEVRMGMVGDHSDADLHDRSQLSFLENARRRLVLWGYRDARVKSVVVKGPKGAKKPDGSDAVYTYPAVQWDFPSDPSQWKRFANFIGTASPEEMAQRRAVMAISPRLHAEFIPANQVGTHVSEDRRQVFVISWQHFLTRMMDKVRSPRLAKTVKLDFQIDE